MSMFRRFLSCLFLCGFIAVASAQPAATTVPPSAEAQQAANTTAAAAVTAVRVEPKTPDFLEHIVDSVLELFDVRSSENTVTHYVIAALFLVAAVLLRRV